MDHPDTSYFSKQCITVPYSQALLCVRSGSTRHTCQLSISARATADVTNAANKTSEVGGVTERLVTRPINPPQKRKRPNVRCARSQASRLRIVQ